MSHHGDVVLCCLVDDDKMISSFRVGPRALPILLVIWK